MITGNKLLKIKVCFVVILFTLPLFLISCGKKGALYLPEEKKTSPPKDISFFQYDKDFIVTWLIEQSEGDEQQSNDIKKLEVYYSLTEFTGSDFNKKAKVLKRVRNFNNFSGVNNRAVLKLDVEKLLDIKEKKYYMGLRYKLGDGGWSDLSDITQVTLRKSLKPVNNLKVKQLSKAMILTWDKTLVDYENRALLDFPKYNLYRKLIDKQKDDLKNNSISFYRTDYKEKIINGYQKINNAPIENNYFEDVSTEGDGDYIYFVTAVYDKDYESLPSNISKAYYKDNFPPSIPQNIVALKATKHIFVVWEEVLDKDLSHYNIYRKGDKGKDFKLIGKSQESNYKDANVKEGGEYFYMVTSVDKQGNESDYSYWIKGKF